MPISLDLSQTVDVILDLDSETPEPRPTFVCRHLSCRDVIKVGELTSQAYEKDKAADGNSNAEINAVLNQILTIQLAGWRNIDQAFSLDAFDDVLTPMEKWELIGKATSAVQIDFLLKKKSLSQRRSAAANFAKNASQTENASSPPADTTALTSPAFNVVVTGPSDSTPTAK